MKKRIKILIAGAGGGGYGVEIMKSLRLSSVPYFIIGCDMSENGFGLFSADKGYVIPPASSPNYLKVLLKICVKEHIQVLIPGSDHDLRRISENRFLFSKKGIFIPINNQEVIDIGLNKMSTIEFLKINGFNALRTIGIDTLDQISGFDSFPVIIKPLIGGGSADTFIAQDRSELQFFCQYLLKNGQKPVVQEYIGNPDNEYTIGILSDQDGKIMSATGFRRYILSGLSNRLRLRSHRKRETLAVSSGISQGEVISDPHIIGQCKKVAQAIGSRGPINIQCRVVKGQVYIFEINPRFSGTTYMRALTGINEPDLLIRKYVLNERIPKVLKSKHGRVLRGLIEQFIPCSLASKIIKMGN